MTMGRALIGTGLLLVCVGGLVVAAEKLNLLWGRLPLDMVWRRGNATVYVPLGACLLVSLVISLVLWLLGRR